MGISSICKGTHGEFSLRAAGKYMHTSLNGDRPRMLYVVQFLHYVVGDVVGDVLSFIHFERSLLVITDFPMLSARPF